MISVGLNCLMQILKGQTSSQNVITWVMDDENMKKVVRTLKN